MFQVSAHAFSAICDWYIAGRTQLLLNVRLVRQSSAPTDEHTRSVLLRAETTRHQPLHTSTRAACCCVPKQDVHRIFIYNCVVLYIVAVVASWSIRPQTCKGSKRSNRFAGTFAVVGVKHRCAWRAAETFACRREGQFSVIDRGNMYMLFIFSRVSSCCTTTNNS